MFEAPSAGAEAMLIGEESPEASHHVDWRIPYQEFLIRGELPSDKTQARWLARRAKSFVLLGDDKELYKHSTSRIVQRCITTSEWVELLHEIHSGACGHHAAPRTLVRNAFRQGFYWPTAVADATGIVWSCKGCQYYAQ